MPSQKDFQQRASDDAIYAQLDQVESDFSSLSRMVMLSVLSYMATVEMNNETFAESHPIPTANQALVTLGYGDHAHRRKGLSIVTPEVRQALILMEKLSLKSKLRLIKQYSADVLNAERGE